MGLRLDDDPSSTEVSVSFSVDPDFLLLGSARRVIRSLPVHFAPMILFPHAVSPVLIPVALGPPKSQLGLLDRDSHPWLCVCQSLGGYRVFHLWLRVCRSLGWGPPAVLEHLSLYDTIALFVLASFHPFRSALPLYLVYRVQRSPLVSRLFNNFQSPDAHATRPVALSFSPDLSGVSGSCAGLTPC